MIRPTKELSNMEFIKLDIIQGIDFTPKNSLLWIFSATTHFFYTSVLQFKNIITMADNYPVGEAAS